MVEELTCARCGTVYRGAAVERLDAGYDYDRDERGVYRWVACVCEHHLPRYAQFYSMRRYEAAPSVLVAVAHSAPFPAVPVRRTKTRVVLRWSDAGDEVHYHAATGKQVGGYSWLEPEEFAIALAILENGGGRES